jgi:chloramphenicol 3-O-phosphotransferase
MTVVLAGNTRDLGIALRPGLEPEQQHVEAELIRIVQDTANADAQFDALPFTQGGRIVSMDYARYLSPAYQTVDERLRFTPSTRNAASAYAKDRLERTLASTSIPPAQRRLVLMSGGPGSGKTTMIRRLLERELADAHIVFDCTSSKLETSKRTLARAQQAGWSVHLVYVYCPYERAVRRVLDRAVREGRYVGLGPGRSMSKISLASQQTFHELRTALADVEGLTFLVVDRGAPDDGDALPFMPATAVSPDGPCWHPPVETLMQIEREAITRFVADGGSETIVELSLRGMTGRRSVPGSSQYFDDLVDRPDEHAQHE